MFFNIWQQKLLKVRNGLLRDMTKNFIFLLKIKMLSYPLEKKNQGPISILFDYNAFLD